MQIGMIGLGRMGANMVRRLQQTCVVFDRSPNAVKDLVKEKAIGACVYRKPYPGLLSEESRLKPALRLERRGQHGQNKTGASAPSPSRRRGPGGV